jgi:hypothetical protein
VQQVEEGECPARDLDDEQRGYAEAEGGVFCHCRGVGWVAGLMLYGGEARGGKSWIEVGMVVAFVIVESFKYA